MKLTLNPEISYITVLTSARHVSQADYAVLAANADSQFFIHATTTAQPGYIVRFGAAGGYEWDEIEATLTDLGLSADFVAMVEAMHRAGYDAAHFDLEMELLPSVPFYLEDGEKVTPLAYDLPILSWHDLDQLQKEIAIAECCADPETADDYFLNNDALFFAVPASDDQDAQIFYMSDVMRVEQGGNMDEAGLTGYVSESAFSSVAVMLSDDSDFISVFRVSN